MSEHTPGPWLVIKNRVTCTIKSESGDYIMEARAVRREEDADFIVLACNQHDALTAKALLVDELVAALKAVVRDARGRSGGSVYIIHAAEFHALKAVLAKHTRPT